MSLTFSSFSKVSWPGGNLVNKKSAQLHNYSPFFCQAVAHIYATAISIDPLWRNFTLECRNIGCNDLCDIFAFPEPS